MGVEIFVTKKAVLGHFFGKKPITILEISWLLLQKSIENLKRI